MRTVLVTGAAKGIGRATALLLDKEGFAVIAGVRSRGDGEALQGAASTRLRPLLLDITDPAQVAEAAAEARRLVGEAGLAGLVNNAGIAVPAPLELIPLEEFRRQIEVNLVGQLAVTQAVLPLLRQAKGRIVNISSVGGRIAGGMLGAYHASKFALEAMSDALRQELRPAGIEVVAVEPGAIATPIWESGSATGEQLFSRLPAEGRERYARAIEGARAFAQRAARVGLPPERVALVVKRALLDQRPRTRYSVGMDAWIGIHLLARLPDRLRDRLFQGG